MTQGLRILLFLSSGLVIGALIAFMAPDIGYVKMAVLPLVILALGLLIRDPFWPLLLLVLAVPLDAVANRAFEGLPLTASTGLLILTLAALAVRMPHEPRETRLGPFDPTVAWALAFVIAMMISMMLAGDREAAEEAAKRMGGMLLITLLIIRIVRTPQQLRLLVLGLVGATLFSGAVLIIETKLGIRLLSSHEAALISAYGDQERSAGASDQNPTTAALMLSTGVIIAMALALEYRKVRLLTVSALAVGLLAVVYSYARSAALVVIAVAPFILWRHRGNRYFPFGLLVLFGMGIASLPLIPESYWARLSSLGNFDTDYTLWRRLGYNIIGLDLLAQNPLFGVGPGNFPQLYVADEYRYMPGRTLTPRMLHNLYLGMAVEVGLVGLAAFLAMIVGGLARLIAAISRSTDPVGRAFGLALVFGSAAFLFGALVTPAQFMKYTWVLIALVAVQARLMQPGPSTTARPPAET